MKAVAPLFGLLLALASSATFAQEIGPGTPFLLSDATAPTLIKVEVMRITSDNTIDVAVWLTPPSPMPSSQDEMLMQLGEICLRYQRSILEAAVPSDEWERLNIFAPLYTVPVPGKPKEFTQYGFAFQLRDGECAFEAPFPQGLVEATRARSLQPLPGR